MAIEPPRRYRENFQPRLRESEPGFTDWAVWDVPITYNRSMAPTLEWNMSEDRKYANFRMVDGFGTIVFAVTIMWPWHGSLGYNEEGRLGEWRQ